jgi:hypothetical protein
MLMYAFLRDYKGTHSRPAFCQLVRSCLMTISDDAAVSVMKYTYHDRMLSWRTGKGW